MLGFRVFAGDSILTGCMCGPFRAHQQAGANWVSPLESTWPPATRRWLGSGHCKCPFRLKPAASHRVKLGAARLEVACLNHPEALLSLRVPFDIRSDHLVAHITRAAREVATCPHRPQYCLRSPANSRCSLYELLPLSFCTACLVMVHK